MKKLYLLLAIQLFYVSVFPQSYQPNWESLDKRPIPEWYRDAKFGIFIHWGVYSVPAWTPKGNYSEWYQYWLEHDGFNGAVKEYHKKKFGEETSYYQLASQFKAELYNPDDWAKLIEESGAKYVVLTSKHHDGFALWPSKEASRDWGFPWNAVEAGPHRDLLGDLFKAIRKTPMHAGMYYSLYEWFNPLWLNDKPRYVSEHMWPQMKDLINTYQPDVFWTDGEWEAPAEFWKSQEFLAWLFNDSPVKDKIVVNDRWGSGVRFHHAGFYTPEYQPDLDFEDHYWEESRGMGYSYGYNRDEDAWDYNSAQSLVISLVDKVSRGGNFLLDIGPDASGKIPPIMQERLMQIGTWMKINSEAIYGSYRWKYPSQWSEGNRNYKARKGTDLMLQLTVDPDPGYAVKECFFTYNSRANNLYAILPRWPKGNQFTIKDLQVPQGSVIELLETKQPLEWKQEGNDVTVLFPVFDPNIYKSAYAYTIKIFNSGAYTRKPAISVNYEKGSVKPLVSMESQGALIRYTTDGSEPTEQSTIYEKPLLINHGVSIHAKAFEQNLLPSAVAESQAKVYTWHPASGKRPRSAGLKYSYYELKPATTADLASQKVSKQGFVDKIDLSLSAAKEYFGLQFEGYIQIADDGIYHFQLSSDDGSRLWIDDQLLVDNEGLHGSLTKTGSAALKKGAHKIRVAYIQASGGSDLELLYQLGNGPMQKLQGAILKH